MSAPSASHDEELVRVALGKMTPVLGAGPSRALVERVLAEQQITLRSPQDLYRLGQVLSALDGFEGAVGSLVSVAAVLRGARPQRPPDR